MRWVVVAIAAAVGGCAAETPPGPPQRVLIATGPAGGTYLRLGEALARIYGEQVPGIHATAEATDGSVSNMRALVEGRADVAFAQADVAYDAYTSHHTPRAMAALYTNALQVITRRDSGVRDLRSLAGRRVGVGPAGSGTGLAADIVMQAHGLAADRVQRQALTFDDAADRVAAGSLDAAFVMASVPADVVARASAAAALRLLPMDAAVMSRIRTAHPFYRPIVIPGGTYTGQNEDVPTLGVDNVLACRADLDEELVRRLTEVLLDSRRALARAHPSAGTIDAELAPAAPIPLHSGARRFYRTREILR